MSGLNLSHLVSSWRHRRAFTLIEMVTSCAILSLLMLALGYGLKLTLVSTGTGAQQATASLEATDIVSRVTEDMNEALSFSEKGTQSVRFTVPRRGDGAGVDEIRYKYFPVDGTETGSGGGGGLLGGLLGGVLGASGDVTYNVPARTLTRQVNNGVVS